MFKENFFMLDRLMSVIISVYKVEDYLDKCVNSIVNQTYKNLEIILVDDGSPDNCPAMCDEWAKKDKRIKVIHKQNGGLSSARNAGLDICTGDYIMFVDSDDYCALNICEVLLNQLEKNDADFSMCMAQKFDEDHQVEVIQNQQSEVSVYSGMDVIEQVYYTNIPYIMTAWGKLYKKELFNNLRYPVGKLHEDEFIIANLLHITKRFVYVTDYLYFYLQRSTSIMGNISEKNIRDLYEATVLRDKFLNEKYPQNFIRNNNLFLSTMCGLYIRAWKYKVLKKEVFKAYKACYKNMKNHSRKEWLFYHCRWIYIILYKVKNLVKK